MCDNFGDDVNTTPTHSGRNNTGCWQRPTEETD